MLQKHIGEQVAKGLTEFVNPYKLPRFRKQVSVQMKELEGLQPFNQGLYHNTHYEALIKYLVNSRKQFRSETSLATRKTIATEDTSLLAVMSYPKSVHHHDYQTHRITDTMVEQLKQSYELACDRHTNHLPCSRLPKMHYDHSRMFHFSIPVDNRFILQMIHFHMGYLLRMPRPITFQELLRMYHIKVLATYEKSLGQDLLSQELCSIAYWELFDAKEEGFMRIDKMVDFLRIFKFNLEPELPSFKSEFSFAGNLFQGEFIKSTDPLEEIVRFDFYRYIFLERNL